MENLGASADHRGMTGQDGQARSTGVVVLAAVAAAALLAGVALAALRSSTANADTVLAAGAGTVLTLADGSSRPAVVGERVPRGATVQAGATGAVLATRDREVHLGQETGVTVLDGARQVLTGGFVLVDSADAPGLELQTPAGLVTVRDDSLVRVDGGPLLRVGVLSGEPAALRAAGRSAVAEVPRYYQVQAAAAGLPGEATPLLLTGDSYERDLARDLHVADVDLNALARRLDTAGDAGPAVLAVRQASLPAAPAVQAGAPASERALAFLLASAVGNGDPLAERDALVRELRFAGGSWGVVAALVSVSPNDVSAALAALLAPAAPSLAAGQGPLDLADLMGIAPAPGAGTPGAGAPGVGPDPGTSSQPDTSSQPGTAPNQPAPGQPSPRPPAPGAPVPVPSPPSTGIAPVDGLVDTVVDTVVRLLTPPSPAPAPASTPAPLLGPVLEPLLDPVLEPLLDPVLEPLREPVLEPLLDPVPRLVGGLLG